MCVLLRHPCLRPLTPFLLPSSCVGSSRCVRGCDVLRLLAMLAMLARPPLFPAQWRAVFTRSPSTPVHFALPPGVSSVSLAEGLFDCGYSLCVASRALGLLPHVCRYTETLWYSQQVYIFAMGSNLLCHCAVDAPRYRDASLRDAHFDVAYNWQTL